MSDVSSITVKFHLKKRGSSRTRCKTIKVVYGPSKSTSRVPVNVVHECHIELPLIGFTPKNSQSPLHWYSRFSRIKNGSTEEEPPGPSPTNLT